MIVSFNCFLFSLKFISFLVTGMLYQNVCQKCSVFMLLLNISAIQYLYLVCSGECSLRQAQGAALRMNLSHLPNLLLPLQLNTAY